MKSDEFETIARHVRTEIPKIKGSRFIGDAFPTPTEEEAKKALARVAHEFADASHHCFAFRINAILKKVQDDKETRSRLIERSSDAGEPGGTAGPPILRQINSAGLTNVLVVVTRYYGGTNLGKGGLIRAYGDAAKAVLGESRRVKRIVEVHLLVRFDYDDTSPAMRMIESFNGRIVESTYDEQSSLLVAVPASKVESFKTAFKDALAGRGTVTTD